MSKASEFSYMVEEKVREMFNVKAQAFRTMRCNDGTFKNGAILEVKDLSGAYAPLGGSATLEGQTNVRAALENYCTADVWAFYVGSRESFEEDKVLVFDKEDAINYIFPRLKLDRESSKKGGKYQLRFSKNYMSEKEKQKIRDAGFVYESINTMNSQWM